MRLSRRAAVPAAVASRLPAGTKVLAAGVDSAGTWLVGTRDALLVVTASAAAPGQLVETVPWERVESASWDRDTDRLRVVEVGEFGQPRPVHTFELVDAGALLPFVRERVTASVVLQRRVEVARGRGFSVAARRPPAGGRIAWSVEYDEGVDPDDPAVQALAQEALAAAADEVGGPAGPI